METDGANYAYADIPVQASVQTARQATPDELVGLGQEIWGAIRASGVAEGDEPGNDALLARLQASYHDFATSFPLVLRWMVQARQFDAKALRKYLYKHAAARLASRQEFLELQAEYLVLLYRERCPRARGPDIEKYRRNLVERLLAEDREFLAMHKQAEEQVARQEAQADQERRQGLLRYLLAQKVAAEARGGSKP
jgi:hypothetical protein